MLLNPRNFHWFLFLWTSFEDKTFKKILEGLQDVFLKFLNFGNSREISKLGMLNQSKKCPKFQHKIGNFGLFSKKCCTIFLNLYELLVFNKTKQITEEKIQIWKMATIQKFPHFISQQKFDHILEHPFRSQRGKINQEKQLWFIKIDNILYEDIASKTRNYLVKQAGRKNENITHLA